MVTALVRLVVKKFKRAVKIISAVDFNYARRPKIVNALALISKNSAVKIPFTEKVIGKICVNSVAPRGVDIEFSVCLKNERVCLTDIIFFVYFK